MYSSSSILMLLCLASLNLFSSYVEIKGLITCSINVHWRGGSVNYFVYVGTGSKITDSFAFVRKQKFWFAIVVYLIDLRSKSLCCIYSFIY